MNWFKKIYFRAIDDLTEWQKELVREDVTEEELDNLKFDFRNLWNRHMPSGPLLKGPKLILSYKLFGIRTWSLIMHEKG